MRRKPKRPTVLLGALMSALACAGPAEVRDGLEGFSARGAADQEQLERRFDSLISPDDLRAWMQEMSSAPNHVGSAHDRANAEYILKNFRDWGWDASIEEFSVLYPTPREEMVELLAPRFAARLREPPVAGDSVADQMGGALPPYNVYGGDGDVTAELVYVNQGMPDDYAELERRHISVTGRIVIARYGGGWRGLKPKLAQEHGAAGCLIYSDPRDDGYGAGDVYPRGGYRPADGVQRGSVEDMTLYAGDPLTPGVGATRDAKRLELKDVKNILKIPVLPLSHADAQPLLSALGGAVAPAAWRGALPITYHLGPGTGAGSSQGVVRLGPEIDLRRHRENPRRGTARPLDHSRQSPRRLGVRGVGSALGTRRSHGGGQGHRRTRQGRLEAAPHPGVCKLGR